MSCAFSFYAKSILLCASFSIAFKHILSNLNSLSKETRLTHLAAIFMRYLMRHKRIHITKSNENKQLNVFSSFFLLLLLFLRCHWWRKILFYGVFRTKISSKFQFLFSTKLIEISLQFRSTTFVLLENSLDPISSPYLQRLCCQSIDFSQNCLPFGMNEIEQQFTLIHSKSWIRIFNSRQCLHFV